MQNRELDHLLTAELQPLEPLPSGNYVIYGAGNIGKEVLEILKASGRTVRAFTDAHITGTVAGLPVYEPGNEAVRKMAADAHTAVIGVFNHTVDPWPLQERLREIGFPRIVSFNEFQEQFSLPPHFWLTARAHVLENRERLRSGWDILGDDASRRIFLDSIRLRLTHDLQRLRQPSWSQQYYPENLPKPRMPLRLIDGGAFTGDTITFLIEEGAKFGAVAAFEPDPENFRLLVENTRRHGASLGDTTLWPCGLSDTTRVANFRFGQGAASAVVEHADSLVQLVALDEVLPSFGPTYIKLDIEGSEIAALRGAAGMIQRHQPSMAVCVYHCPADLWEIPLYLRALLPSHRIVLRYHAYQAFDLVAYAFADD